MPDTTNYNEKPVAGTEHERTCRVLIEHPFQGTPSAMTVEEIITIKSDGRTQSELNGNLYLTFDPTNPDDMTIYNLINAKIVAARQARDAAKASQSTTTTP